MRAALLIAFALSSCADATPPPSAEAGLATTGWSTEFCAGSVIATSPVRPCNRGAMIRRVLPTGGAQEGYNNQTAGTIKGTQINARILWAANRGTIITPYTEAQAIDQMRRDWPEHIGAARDLSQAVGMGAVTYAFFTRETNQRSLSCVAFDVAGPPKLTGYAWRVSAFACQPPEKTADPNFLKAVLASIRVGPASDDMNALGGKLQPLSR